MQQIVSDLVAEQDYLDAAIAGTPDEVWEQSSSADGWLMLGSLWVLPTAY